MRILWFVNTPFSEMVEHLSLKGNFMGCWMSALKQALINIPDLRFGFENQLGIVCALPNVKKYERFQIDKVTYFCIPKSRKCEYLRSYDRELSHCVKAVKDFNPDIIHVHGTEEFYGLITERIVMPVVISIQGILSACIRVYFDDINWKEILLSPRIIQHYMMMSRKTKTERKIFRINRYFIGRTLWDKSHLMSLASGNFMYYLCHEVMRKEFYQQEWTINTSEPWTIACISSPYAYKGVNSILDAIGYLRKKIPRVMLYIYGSFFQNGYGAFLRNKVKKSRLMNNVQFCGFENSKELARRLRNVRAYVIASHVENGSNSLQEAMLVGTPSVVSFAGGMPSIAEHEKSCLMFPRGDSAVMAECLYKVLNDEKLAVRISKAARIKARKINNPERIAKRLLQIYKDVIARRGKNR